MSNKLRNEVQLNEDSARKPINLIPIILMMLPWRTYEISVLFGVNIQKRAQENWQCGALATKAENG